MHNGWAVCSAGSSVPQKKQKGIYTAAAQVTVARSPSQAWGRKTGRWSGRWSDSWGTGRLGWGYSHLQNSLLVCSDPVTVDGSLSVDFLETDRCLEVQQPYRPTPESLAEKRRDRVSGAWWRWGCWGMVLLGPSGCLWRGLGGYHPQ